jgi:shikimate kinase
MGSGKTTVGRMLAERLGWAFHDLDTEVERRAGKRVPEIFAESGEAAFRRQESAALAGLLGRSHTVVALGGGAPETLGNRLLLEQTPKTAVVYLAAPLETLVARCERQAAAAEGTERPLLGEAAARFKARHPLYERIAKHKVITTDATPEAVVDLLLDVLENRG